MTTKLPIDRHEGMLLDLDANATALDVPVGGVIFPCRGSVWITQEGLRDDFVIGRGERYLVQQRGQIVISAVHGNAQIWVASQTEAAAAHGDVFTLLRERAHRLRREALAGALRAARQFVTGQLAHAAAAIRRAAQPARRAAEH